MKIKFLLLPLLFSVGFGDFCFADGCDDLIVNVKNTSNTDLYATFDNKQKVAANILLSSHGGTLEPLTISNKGSHSSISLRVMTSSLKNAAWPSENFLSDDVVSYTKIGKYHSSTGTAGPIVIDDPSQSTTNYYHYGNSASANLLRHSTNAMSYKISFKDIYRGNCTKGKPGAITIEIAAVSDDE